MTLDKSKIVRPRRIERLFKKLQHQTWHQFPQKGKGIEAPKEQGVYIISKGRVVWHVGRTTRAKNGLKQRLTAHLRGRSSFTDKVFKRKGDKLRNGYRYRYIVIEKAEERAFLEAFAAGSLCPRHIGTSEGKVIE
jgi:hypothetical protein